MRDRKRNRVYFRDRKRKRIEDRENEIDYIGEFKKVCDMEEGRKECVREGK